LEEVVEEVTFVVFAIVEEEEEAINGTGNGIDGTGDGIAAIGNAARRAMPLMSTFSVAMNLSSIAFVLQVRQRKRKKKERKRKKTHKTQNNNNNKKKQQNKKKTYSNRISHSSHHTFA
jgi:uncharacterized protein YlxW (UPF0749 family)